MTPGRSDLIELEMNALERSLETALMAGIQTGVGAAMHPGANAMVCIAFKDAAGAEEFRLAYLDVRAKIARERGEGT